MNGRQLRAFRIDRLRMTQKELASALGVTERTVYRWESLHPRVEIPRVAAIAVTALEAQS